MRATGKDTSADRMRERADSTALTYLPIDADRRALAGGIVAGIFLGLVGIGVAADPATLVEGDPVETLYQAYVGATVTVVTLVVTINQSVLSEELGTAGDQQQRMDETLQFRDDVADALGLTVSPAEPSAFRRAFATAIGDRAEALGDAAEALVDDAVDNARNVADRLEDGRFGSFGVVSAALDFEYAWKLYAARRLRAERTDLSDDARAALEALIEALELFGPAREHIRTLYFRTEFVDLTRVPFATAVPAVLVAAGSLLYFDPAAGGSDAGLVLGVDRTTLTIAATSAVALSPFAALLSYVIRIATVAERTLSTGPFVLRPSDRDTSVDWDGSGGPGDGSGD